MLRRLQIGGGFFGIRVGGQRPLNDEPGPFDAMSGGRAVGLEGIVRTVPVLLQLRNPAAGKMLRDAPAVVFGPAGHPVDDAACADAVWFCSKGVSDGQKRLHRVHIGVKAPVGVQNGEFCVPGVPGEPLRLIPEAQVIEGQRLVQQLFRAVPAGQQGGGGGQDHKCMGIALLGGHNGAIQIAPGVPAAVCTVMELALQSLQRRIGQRAYSEPPSMCPML